MSDEFDEWLRVASGGWPAIRVPPGKPRVELIEYPTGTGYSMALLDRAAVYATAHGWWRASAGIGPAGFLLVLCFYGVRAERERYTINVAASKQPVRIADLMSGLQGWVEHIKAKHKMNDFDFESGPVLTFQTLLEYYDKIRR